MNKELEMLEGLDAPHLLALVNKLGGRANVDAILRDDKKVTITIEDVIRTFIDKNGRAIPSLLGVTSPVVDANYGFKLKQPKLDYSGRLSRLFKYLGGNDSMLIDDFESRINAIINRVKSDSTIRNLLKGVYLPFAIPQMKIDDYGQTIERVFLPAVERAYKDEFPNRNFVNYRKGELENQVAVISGTRHDQLIAKLAQGPIFGVICPTALQGCSIPADREAMANLPDDVYLGGGVDILASMIMYPDILARDFNTPGLDMAALQWRSSEFSLVLGASADRLGFGRRYLRADVDYSAPLVLL
jgi:hypothetical protein